MFYRFKELSIGDTFDFVDEANPSHVSYHLRCVKTGPRSYDAVNGSGSFRIGTTMCKVFHVEHSVLKL